MSELEKIIDECRVGNLHNFRKLIELSTPMLYSVGFRICGDDDTARDIVQDTMVKVWKKIGSIKSAAAYKTWLYRIAVNTSYDYLRQRRKSAEVRLSESEWQAISRKMSYEPAPALENGEIAKLIGVITQNLSPKQKVVFVLCDLEGLSHEQVAEATGLHRRAIRSNLYYARKNIELMLEKLI